MAVSLDRFRKVVLLMRSTTFPAERDAAEHRARNIAVKLGLAYEEALRTIDASPHTNPGAAAAAWRRQEEEVRKAEENLRKAQEDRRKVEEDLRRSERELHQRREAERRGREAEAERQRQERERQRRQEEQQRREEEAARLARMMDVIRRYGHTVDDVLKPTPREALILAAVAKWRRLTKDKRWTKSLDGWGGGPSTPAHIVAAVCNAYPMPATYQEAVAEMEEWKRREEDRGIVLDLNPKDFSSALDLPAELRCYLVRDLVDYKMPLTDVRDIADRMRRYRKEGTFFPIVEDALLRDLENLAQQMPPRPDAPAQAPSPLNRRIVAALTRDSCRSDREIAREIPCSPTIVGRVRKEVGFHAEIRTVRRKGQIYEMRRKAKQPLADQ